MKQGLQLKLSQHLALTPQLQQSIRLLQLSTLELNQEIEQALQENPLLEREDTGEAAAFTPSGDALSAVQEPAAPEQPREFDEPAELGWGSEMPSGQGSRDPEDDVDSGEIQAAAVGLREHLNAQLALTQLAERERRIVEYLVEALDDDGYLTQTLEELADSIAGDADVDREELDEELAIALRHLQHLDPPGIGARNPQECLDLQLQSLPACPGRELAQIIVRQHLEQFAARDFVRIKKALGCDDDELRIAQGLIRSLNPRPGAQFAPLDTRYVIPDVMVRKVRGAWIVSLNSEAMPRLRINRLYANILQSQRGGRGGGPNSSLAGQLQEAKWLIKNVQQRFDTIQRVAQAIVERQRAFFDHGEVAMRPLTLREIADTVSLHESTISRVTTQKYLSSPRGIFELKYFFGSHVATDSGGAASSTAIRALIKQLVGAEDGHKPLSDARIAEILGEQGIVVARRTVAKYRESLNIPPVTLRKAL
jgi:RNA polymerase sigma-54 factor